MLIGAFLQAAHYIVIYCCRGFYQEAVSAQGGVTAVVNSAQTESFKLTDHPLRPLGRTGTSPPVRGSNELILDEGTACRGRCPVMEAPSAYLPPNASSKKEKQTMGGTSNMVELKRQQAVF